MSDLSVRVLVVTLILALTGLQYRIWIGEGSFAQLMLVREQISLQQQENERLDLRNNQLAAEVVALQQGVEAVEELARQELGMIRENEIFYLIAD